MPSKRRDKPRHQHGNDFTLLLDLTYGVLADIEAEDLAREASFAQGLRAMIGGILTAS
ncbi:uid operon repressor [Escherichia coli]|nr:uid operon repressor [Escherichia coli]